MPDSRLPSMSRQEGSSSTQSMTPETGGAEEVAALPVPTTTLETIATDALLRTVWKRTIRPALRTGTFYSFYLATDAVPCCLTWWWTPGLPEFPPRQGTHTMANKVDLHEPR